MNKQVFIINGHNNTGKDTFVNLVSLNMNSKYDFPFQSVVNFSSVDKVKDIAKLIGWDGKSKTEKDRKFLSDLKLLCTEYNDMPFVSISEKVNTFKKDEQAAMLFLHIREPEEIEKAKQAFNAKTILITRGSINHITSNMADKNVFNYNYDIVVDNDANIWDYDDKVAKFVEDFLNDNIKSKY